MVESLMDVSDDGFGLWGRVDERGDEANVVVDVGEGVRSEGKSGEAGFEDGGEGFEAVGDTGDNEVGFGGDQRFQVSGFVERPTVLKDWEVARGECGDELETVFGAGAEVFEAVERGEREGDGGLERGYAHRS